MNLRHEKKSDEKKHERTSLDGHMDKVSNNYVSF